MVELTFTVSATGERRTVTGELASTDPVEVEEQHENRPDWRVESDRSVTLLSANTDVEAEGFGEDATMSGYCLEHNVHVERVAGHERCPRCRMVEDVRDRERELMARRADPDMHPSVDAPRR